MITGNDTLVLMIKRVPNAGILLITGIWSLGWAVLMSTVILGFAQNRDKLDGAVLLFMSLFFVAGLFMFRVFLWHWQGYEQVMLNVQGLSIKKMGTFFTITQRFELAGLEGFRLTDKPGSPYWIRLWGLGGGQIQFDYLGQQRYFGQTLTESEAKEMIAQLNEQLKTLPGRE